MNGQCPTMDSKIVTRLSAVLIAATSEMLSSRGESCSAFAVRLVVTLEQIGLLEASEPTTADEYQRWHSRTIKRVARIIDDTTPMPADWLLPWLSALDDPQRTDCQQKLAAMQGLMWVRATTILDDAGNVLATIASDPSADRISRMTQAFGEVLSHAKPAFDCYDLCVDKTGLTVLQSKLGQLFLRVYSEIKIIEASAGIPAEIINLAVHSLF